MLLLPYAPPGIAVVNVIYDTQGAGSGTGTTKTAPGAQTAFAHTAAAGADVFAYVCVVPSSGTGTCSGVTFGGTSMGAAIGSVLCQASATFGTTYLFYLAGAGTGSSQNVIVTTAGTSTTDYWVANTFSYLNVASIGSAITLQGASGVSETSQGPITNVTGGMVLQAFGGYTNITTAGSNPTFTAQSGGTSRYNNGGFDGSASHYSAITVQDSTAASPTFTQTGGEYASAIAVVMTPT